MHGDEQLELIVTPEEAPPTPPPAPAEEFPFNTLPPEVTFTVRDVPPPSPSYISPDDRLRIEARNSIAGLTLEVHTRLLKPNGQIIQSLHTYTPTAARALNTWTVPLVEGFLLTCTVNAPANAKPGGCYVRALLIRGSAPVVPIGQVLLAGYVVTGSALVWPYPRYVHPVEGPGRLRVIVGTDPAPGNAAAETVPAGARWALRAVWIYYETSAVVGNRYVTLWLSDGVNTWWQSTPVAAQGPGVLWTYWWAIGTPARITNPPGLVRDTLADRVFLAAGWTFIVNAYYWDPGDDFSAPVYCVEEWIEP